MAKVELKQPIVEEISNSIKDAQSVVLVNYSGLTVEQDTILRKELREADAIYMDELRKAGLYREIWQAFATLPDVKTVGVMGDERTYAYLVGLRAVSSSDGMTSDWYKIPYDVLEKIANRIDNEVDGANRVVYDITSKPPGTIEWE